MKEKQELNEAMVASRTSDKTGKAFAELISKINRINGEN